MTGVLRLILLSGLLGLARGQCFGPGDIAASVIVPLVLAGVIVAVVLIALWKAGMIVFCPRRKGVKSPEGNGATGSRVSNHGEVYSNPGFVDDPEMSPELAMEEGHGGMGESLDNGKTPKDKKVQSPKKGGIKGSPVSQQTSVSSKSKIGFELPGKNLNRMVSTTSLDDTFLNSKPEVVSVCLQSQDFIGLGFNIQGSIRDGIRVSQVHNRGPAIESGKIHAGDRIQSVTISFETMVYEDALTILSYASPYPVKITLQKNGRLVPDRRSASDLQTQLNHPIYRSQSLDTLNTVGKESAFKKKRNFSEMKPDSYRNGHSKIHSVQLSSCKEGQAKHGQDKHKWDDVSIPVFHDGKYSEQADKLFSDADRLFLEAKRNADKRDDVNIKVKSENVKASPAEVSLNTTADKTDSSFFDVTAGTVSTLNDSSLPSDTLDDITVSVNDTPAKEVTQDVSDRRSETAKAALDFDAMFGKMERMEKPPDYDSLQRKFDQSLNINTENSRENDSKAGRTVNLFDVELEMDAAKSRVANVSDDFKDAKQSVVNEAKVSLWPEVDEGVMPRVESSRLNAALGFDKRSNVEEEDIVPQSRKKAFDIDTQIEFEDVEVDINNDNEVRDLTEVAEKLSEDMLRDSSSVEASVGVNNPSHTEAVVEENLEAVSVRRDSSSDKIYGASMRDSRSLFDEEPSMVSEVVTQEFTAPKFAQMSQDKATFSSGDEYSSAEEGEYQIESSMNDENIEVSHDLSAEDLNSFKVQMMADRASRVEASSGDVVHELRRNNSNENTTDLYARPMTRAMSYDVAMGAHENTVQREDRPGSFKSEKKTHSDSGFLDWSGKRLVRSGSFSEIPGVDSKDGEDRDWTFNNNIEDEAVKHQLKKYKNYQDLRGSDSESEEQSSGLIRTKIYPGFENLANLSGNNSGASSRSSSPVTANGGDSSTHTSHYVTKSYHISTVESSQSQGDGNLSHAKYSFTVRSGSDGEESDSMA